MGALDHLVVAGLVGRLRLIAAFPAICLQHSEAAPSPIPMAKHRNPYTLLGTFLLVVSAFLALGLGLLMVREYSKPESFVSENIDEEKPPVTAAAVVEVQSPEPTRLKQITIVDGDQVINIETSEEKVGLALIEAGLIVRYADVVMPALDAWIADGETIIVDRANLVTLLVDGFEIEHLTRYTKTADIIADANITFSAMDTTSPGLQEEVLSGTTLEIIRVTEDVLVEEEAIPFDTVWQGTDELELDQIGLISQGSNGALTREVRQRFENGLQTESSVNEWVSKEPVNEVMGFGTRINIRSMDTPEGTIEYWRVVEMRVTAYTASSSGKPPDHPAYGITASGLPAGKGIVAIDPKVVPFRSQVYVPGYGTAIAGDTGGGVKGRWIDLGYPDGEIEAWRGVVDVYYLTPVPPVENINYLIPDFVP